MRVLRKTYVEKETRRGKSIELSSVVYSETINGRCWYRKTLQKDKIYFISLSRLIVGYIRGVISYSLFILCGSTFFHDLDLIVT